MPAVDQDDLTMQIRACWLSAIEKLDYNELVTLMDDYSACIVVVASRADAKVLAWLESRVHDLVEQMGYLEATGSRP